MPDRRKVLIIDDEIDLSLLLKDYFLRKKFEVHVSHSLTEGLEILNTLMPNILFLDNNLPDGTGWNLAPQMALDNPGMYIVLISAFHPTAPKMPTGSKFSIIEKPISLVDLDKQFPESELASV